ncbi:MAG TPA: hypothetical protein VG778_07070 [Blastocatellia bacterium]|nr:hypothetical protein [Blastocatellia bacterium]
MKIINALMLIAAIGLPTSGQWTPQVSPSTARLRAISVVDDRVAWASGANGTCLRTTNGGMTWERLAVPDSADLDFRDVQAFDATTAYLLSIGEGTRSRIYKTTNGGIGWTLQFMNNDPKAFFDAIAFWDSRSGLCIGDPVDGRFVVMRTTDGGATWLRAPTEGMPRALEGEAAFAASGTCVTVQGRSNAWFVTGGAAARVFRSTDRGESWTAAPAPIISGSASRGIFSVAFADEKNGVVVGGDYQKEQEALNTAAITRDGGRTWHLSASMPGGYRSCVAYLPGSRGLNLLAVGPSGSDFSSDRGATWSRVGAEGFHALSFSNSGRAGWAVGENGRIAGYSYERRPNR